VASGTVIGHARTTYTTAAARREVLRVLVQMHALVRSAKASRYASNGYSLAPRQ
jgi:hypothetical protein